MSEREVKARVKLLIISTWFSPAERCFAQMAEEVTEQTVRDLSRQNAYKRINCQLNHHHGCLDRSMRLCINDLHVQAFARQMNQLTGFRIVTENIEFGFLLDAAK